MAYTTINKSTVNHSTLLYSGNDSARSLTGVGHQPDLVWIKQRDGTAGHALFDSNRGHSNYISTSSTNAQLSTPSSGYVTAFDSDGFSGVTGSSSYANWNGNGSNYVAWNWKAGGAASSNTDGSGITSTVSANTTSGFSIVKYTGTGNAAHTIGHGLGVKPECVIMRPLGYSGAWWIAHKWLATDNLLEFNNNAQAAISGFGGGGLKYSTFTTSVIGGGDGGSNSDLWNKSGEDYIAYCFADKPGYQKIGFYDGNAGGGANQDNFQYCGFKPKWIIIKCKSDSETWQILDSEREGYNNLNDMLQPNGTSVESSDGDNGVQIYSNGFNPTFGTGHINRSGKSYVWMAIGQTVVGTNNIPATAR